MSERSFLGDVTNRLAKAKAMISWHGPRVMIVLMTLALMIAACATSPATTTTIDSTKSAEPTQPPSGPPEDAWGVITYKPSDSILIGVGGPFSGDGADLAAAIERGVELALTEQPNFEGFAIQSLRIDDAGDPKAAAETAVANPQLVALVGHARSAANRDVIPIYEKNGVVMISPTASFPDLTDPGSAVFNRVAFNWSFQGQAVAEHVFKTLGLTSLAIVYSDDPFYGAIAAAAESRFTSLDGQVALKQSYPPGTTDFSAPLDSLKAVSPQAIFLVGTADEATAFLNQMLDLDVLSNAYLVGSDEAFISDSFREAATRANRDFGQSIGVVRVNELPDSEALRTFLAAHNLDVASNDRYVPSSYDATQMILEAIRQVAVRGGGGELYIGHKALADAVRRIAQFSGLTGQITCNEHGDCSAATAEIHTPAAVEILVQAIQSTGIIPLEQVDLLSTGGWLAEDGKSYELIGAVTVKDADNQAAAVLYIPDTANVTYPPGTYLIKVLDPDAPVLVLIDQNGNQVDAQEAARPTREEVEKQLGTKLPQGQSKFVFVQGSVRCDSCPWWLAGFCYCIRCK